MESTFKLIKEVYPPTNRPYRVIETYLTSDGYRSRICNGVFETQEEAEKDIDRRRSKE